MVDTAHELPAFCPFLMVSGNAILTQARAVKQRSKLAQFVLFNSGLASAKMNK
jgi:hypothetical protein